MQRLKQLYDWLDNRTGIKEHLREALFETVPGGSRWRYVWGSTLTFTLKFAAVARPRASGEIDTCPRDLVVIP